MKQKCGCNCLHAVSFGLACGVLWGIILFIMAIFAGTFGNYGVGFVMAMSTLYVGYHATFIGALIGAVWGFLDGFIGGMVFIWLYNVFCRKFCRCEPESK